MKNVSIKVYRPTGEFINEWNDAVFDGFSKEINSGLGECIITLGKKFDNYTEDINIGNIINISISDKETTEIGNIIIYSGYISTIEYTCNNSKENILVHVLGNYTKLSLDVLKDSSQVILYSDTTNGLSTTDPATEADIGLILRAIIKRYREETVNPMIFSNLSSIPIIGETATYTISMKTYREAIDSIVSMLPSGYFWYCDENGIFSIKQKPSSPTHTFEFGKHFSSIKIERSLEKLRNFLLIWNGEPSGGVFSKYEDVLSISKYGRKFEYLVDYGINDITSSDKIGAKFISDNKNPSLKLICEIIDNSLDDNGYDIESINPGDTCRFVGFNSALTNILEDNMLITKVDYLFNKAIIEVQLIKSGLVNWQDKTYSKVKNLSSYNIPESYT